MSDSFSLGHIKGEDNGPYMHKFQSLRIPATEDPWSMRLALEHRAYVVTHEKGQIVLAREGGLSQFTYPDTAGACELQLRNDGGPSCLRVALIMKLSSGNKVIVSQQPPVETFVRDLNEAKEVRILPHSHACTYAGTWIQEPSHHVFEQYFQAEY